MSYKWRSALENTIQSTPHFIFKWENYLIKMVKSFRPRPLSSAVVLTHIKQITAAVCVWFCEEYPHSFTCWKHHFIFSPAVQMWNWQIPRTFNLSNLSQKYKMCKDWISNKNFSSSQKLHEIFCFLCFSFAFWHHFPFNFHIKHLKNKRLFFMVSICLAQGMAAVLGFSLVGSLYC